MKPILTLLIFALFADSAAADFPKGRPATIQLKDVPVARVIDAITLVGNTYAIVAPDVTETTSLDVKDVPWIELLDRVVAANGLEYRKEGGVFVVAKKGKLPPTHAWKGAPLSVVVRNASLTDLLRLFTTNDVHFVVEGTTPPVRITKRLHHARADQAVDLLLWQAGAAVGAPDAAGVRRVMPDDNAKAAVVVLATNDTAALVEGARALLSKTGALEIVDDGVRVVDDVAHRAAVAAYLAKNDAPKAEADCAKRTLAPKATPATLSTTGSIWDSSTRGIAADGDRTYLVLKGDCLSSEKRRVDAVTIWGIGIDNYDVIDADNGEIRKDNRYPVVKELLEKHE